MNKHKCPTCGQNRVQSFRFDTYFCRRCDVWLEPRCEDPQCTFCRRPEKPSQFLNDPFFIYKNQPTGPND